MATNTTNFGFTLPSVNSPTDENLWGGQLNGNFTSLDSLLLTASNITIRATTGTDPITAADQNKIILANATAGAFAETLPAASSVSNGFMVIVKKTDSTANAITITPSGADTIDGLSTFVISVQYGFVALVSDHVSNWNIIGQSTVAVTGVVKTIHQQVLNSGTTYTPTAGMLYAQVKIIGGGGAGAGCGGSTSPTGSTGGTTTFNSITALGGSGGTGTNIGQGGAGGTGGAGSGFRLAGVAGQSGASAGQTFATSGNGGGNGGGLGVNSGNGGAGVANTGGGGGGAYAFGSGQFPAGGGGSGEEVTFIVPAAASYSFSIGAGGVGGTGTGGAALTGGSGGSGVIYVTEFCSQ